MHHEPERDFHAVHDIARLARSRDREIGLALAGHTMNRLAQHPRRAITDAMHHFVDEIDVAVQQLPGGQVHRRSAPGTPLVGVRDRRLLSRYANQAIGIVMVAQRDGNAAHDAAVPSRTARILLIREPARFERLLPAFDQRERALGGRPDPATVHLHPFHPAPRDVVLIEPLGRQQRFTEQQRHRGVVIVGGVLGGWSEVDDAIREGFADGFRRSQVLGRDAQLIASNKAKQRAPGARDELRVSPVHWATN